LRSGRSGVEVKEWQPYNTLLQPTAEKRVRWAADCWPWGVLLQQPVALPFEREHC